METSTPYKCARLPTYNEIGCQTNEISFCYGLPVRLPYIVITCARIDSIKHVCSEPPCCPGAFSDLSSVHHNFGDEDGILRDILRLERLKDTLVSGTRDKRFKRMMSELLKLKLEELTFDIAVAKCIAIEQSYKDVEALQGVGSQTQSTC